MKFGIAILLVIGLVCGLYSSGQITIDRIDQMPALPHPYEMRNWEQVTAGYDSLVFDLDATGEYLPLIWMDNNTVNYPQHGRFGLQTVVGQDDMKIAEAINVIPAVISASLIGIDKSSQNGHNWVLKCEEFFNRREEENVYLNNFVGNSGSDWWYDTMPNIFFYQLKYFYPNQGDFEYQFTKVADRWSAAVDSMGGDVTPWQVPDMNYRGWYLASMSPNASGVRQPEAAGAIAWILYNAYKKTGQEKYRIRAEWCLEYLNGLNENPSYELQLPYGAYTAARMNAEVNTNYNVEKLLNWCFTPEGNRRNWGATIGKWGDYDCYGLIGEAKPNVSEGYAFYMNGVEQFGALIPLLRYDDRFARTLGKWALNIANASRLFYPNYLPDSLQDCEAWSHQYDPNSYIAHEAMREKALNEEKRPFATGDFLRNDWGPTNLSLYSSSHVGIFGSIIDTTDVEAILQLDLLKTDYYHDQAYPTYLYYNPYDQEKTVQINTETSRDIYDAVNNDIIKTSVNGQESIGIPSGSSRILVFIPAGAELQYNLNTTFADGVPIDFYSGKTVDNYPLRIKSLQAEEDTIAYNDQTNIYCTAEDPGDNLSYAWFESGENIGAGPMISWQAPPETGTNSIVCRVTDSNGLQVSDTVRIRVLEEINYDPEITDLSVNPRKVEPGSEIRCFCLATDPNQDSINYNWSSTKGEFTSQDSATYWHAPLVEGLYYLVCQALDGKGGGDRDSIQVAVKTYTEIEDAKLLAYYSFNGNAADSSGFQNPSHIYGAELTADKIGQSEKAYYFDGQDDYISVENNTLLNFQDSITVSLWCQPNSLYTDRESYMISHGNWQNRWKISILPEKKLRWTVNTSSGIKDLDSESSLQKDSWYHVVGVFDGSQIELYVNGNLDAQADYSGKLNTTQINLTIGQALPSEDNYNFNGVIDEVRIYNKALDLETIKDIYANESPVDRSAQKPQKFALSQNYPNPFNPETSFSYAIPKTCNINITIYNIIGERVAHLVNTRKKPGNYTVNWRADDISSGVYIYHIKAGEYENSKKCLLIK